MMQLGKATVKDFLYMLSCIPEEKQDLPILVDYETYVSGVNWSSEDHVTIATVSEHEPYTEFSTYISTCTCNS